MESAGLLECEPDAAAIAALLGPAVGTDGIVAPAAPAPAIPLAAFLPISGRNCSAPSLRGSDESSRTDGGRLDEGAGSDSSISEMVWSRRVQSGRACGSACQHDSIICRISGGVLEGRVGRAPCRVEESESESKGIYKRHSRSD